MLVTQLEASFNDFRFLCPSSYAQHILQREHHVKTKVHASANKSSASAEVADRNVTWYVL